MAKLTSLASLAAPLVVFTRTSADVVGGPVTAHAYDPDAAVLLVTEAATGVHVTPPSRLRSTATLLPAPRLCVHAIDCVEPAIHVTAVLGVVTVIVSPARSEEHTSELQSHV